jgi:hypothetical protein
VLLGDDATYTIDGYFDVIILKAVTRDRQVLTTSEVALAFVNAEDDRHILSIVTVVAFVAAPLCSMI